MSGWIKLHRKIRDHWLYQEGRQFSRFEAWIDLLMRANYIPNKILLGNELIDVDRGQFVTSIRKLIDAWNWSNTKVYAFLDLLQEDGMIEYKSDTKKTVITIVNYSIYHNLEDEETTRKRNGSETETKRKHTEKKDKELIKKDKEDNIPPISPKPKKEKYAEYVSMTNAEYEKLVGTHGEEFTRRCIEVLDNYKGANGKRYKSDYRAILNWVVDRVKEEQSRKVGSLPKGGKPQLPIVTDRTQEVSDEEYQKMLETARRLEK